MSLVKRIWMRRAVVYFSLVLSSIGGWLWSLTAHAEILYQNNFDSMSDWTSGDQVAPEGWFSYRASPVWAPSTGYASKHEAIEILSSNVDKARGGIGKSAVFWRESHEASAGLWRNDKILSHRISGGSNEVYVEFYITFSPNWTISGSGADTSKVFRMYSWDEDGSNPPRLYNFFPNGDAGPMYMWFYSQNQDYGLRNFMAFRGGPHGENYYMSRPDGFPRAMNRGDSSLNFTTEIAEQGVGGTMPQIPDRVNGGLLSDNLNQVVRHEQVFGMPSEQRWTKLAFYVKMNSAPGVADGVLMQWIDGVQIFNQRKLPWIGPTNSVDTINWDIVAFGGNDFFARHPVTDQYEEWYAIDDIVVLDSIPEYLGGSIAHGECV